MALLIINQFDEIMYDSIKNDEAKKLVYKEFCQKTFVIKHTTSSRCSDQEEVVDPETGESYKLKITFKDRGCLNKLQFLIYRIFRVWFVSVYYYFMPFSIVLINVWVPIRY